VNSCCIYLLITTFMNTTIIIIPNFTLLIYYPYITVGESLSSIL
jgi:hypothetical protein